MATKKQDDLFPTTALVPSGHQFPTTLAPSQRTRSLEKAERWIVGESHKQQLVIREQQRKAGVAHEAIGAIYASGYETYRDTAEQIWDARRPNGRDPELQRHLDYVAAETIQSVAGGIKAVTLGSAQAILAETTRELYRETREPTWFDRLLGEG